MHFSRHKKKKLPQLLPHPDFSLPILYLKAELLYLQLPTYRGSPTLRIKVKLLLHRGLRAWPGPLTLQPAMLAAQALHHPAILPALAPALQLARSQVVMAVVMVAVAEISSRKETLAMGCLPTLLAAHVQFHAGMTIVKEMRPSSLHFAALSRKVAPNVINPTRLIASRSLILMNLRGLVKLLGPTFRVGPRRIQKSLLYSQTMQVRELNSKLLPRQLNAILIQFSKVGSLWIA